MIIEIIDSIVEECAYKIDEGIRREIEEGNRIINGVKFSNARSYDKQSRRYWVWHLFSNYDLKNTDITFATITTYIRTDFKIKKESGYIIQAPEHLKEYTSNTNWNTERFYKFIESLSENEKENIITRINEKSVFVSNINQIPETLRQAIQKALPKNDEVDSHTIDTAVNDNNSDELEQIVDNEKEAINSSEPTTSPNIQPNESTPVTPATSSLTKHFSSHALIAIIFIFVLFIIFLIIFFVAKNRPNSHVDDKILPNSDITTALTSADTVSTEITTISLTSSTDLNIRTTTASSEAATISTPIHTTVKIDGNRNKVDPPVIVVTVNVDNNSHSNTETHTESPQNNNHQDPPVTQEQTTTPLQIATLPISTPEIEISSTEAHRGDSDVCISVNFENLKYKGSYNSIGINFNALYDNTLIFKNCTVSPNNADITGLTFDNGHISFYMYGDYCENDVTVNLFFDIPDDAPDGNYTIQMLEEASTITLYTNDWLNPRVLLSLDRMGQIHVS